MSAPKNAPEPMIVGPWDDGMSTPQNAPEPMIVGLPQQMVQPMGQQIIYVQQPSSSPKILGIFVIIWGAISFLGLFALFLPQVDPLTGEEIVVPFIALALQAANSVLVAFTCVVGGYWMTEYQRRGIHLALLGIGLSFMLGLATVLVGGDGGLGNFLGDEAAFAFFAIVEGICSVICGLLVAIPLMNSAQGLDNSSLLSPLK